jgi:hypothetical protein
MKTFAASLLCLFSTLAVAQEAKTPEDIQAWITAHLGKPAHESEYDGAKYAEGMSFTFEQCRVTAERYRRTVYSDGLRSTWTWSADLSKALPGKLSVKADEAPKRCKTCTTDVVTLSINFRSPISIRLEQVYTDVDGKTVQLDPGVSEYLTTHLVFSDVELANRQLNAWRDLIKSCGGKDVSDNLY